MDLLVGGPGVHVHQLHGPGTRGGRHGPLFHHRRGHGLGQSGGDAQEHICLVLLDADPEAGSQLAEHDDVRAGLADRLDHRLDQLHGVVAVPARDVVVLEERGRRQDHVGVARRVGAYLVEDDGEQIFALQPLQNAVLVGRRDERVAVVDEQHLDGRRCRSGQHFAETVHVHQARGRLGRPAPAFAVDAPGRAVAHRVPAAGHSERVDQCGQGQHRQDGLGAVAVTLEAPSTADDGRLRRGVQVHQPRDGGRRESRDCGDAIHGPRGRALAEGLDAGHVGGQELVVDCVALEEFAGHAEREHEVGAWPDRQVQVRLTCEGRGSRVDDHERRAVVARLLQEGHQVNARRRGIRAPHDNQSGVGVVLVRHARHLAVHGLRGGARRRCAHGARET